MRRVVGIVLMTVATIVAAQLSPSRLNLAESIAIRVGEPRLQQELHLSTDQATSVNKIVKQHSAKQSAINGEMSKSKSGNFAGLVARMEALEASTAREIMGVLDVGQRGRLWEIAIQDAGPWALRSAVVAKKVGLTAAQSKQVESIASKTISELGTLSEQMGKQIEAVPSGSTGEAKRRAITKSFTERSEQIEERGSKAVLSLLSKSQIAKWVAAKGKPFKL